jgi:hypothetical protein
MRLLERMDGQTNVSRTYGWIDRWIEFCGVMYNHNGFCSTFAMSPPCCSVYVRGNDARYGVKVALCDAATGKVTGLQCRFCIAFGREEKVGSKRKPASTVQGWNAPFRYENFEKHLRDQHPSQWDVYNAVTSADERNSFVAGGAPGGKGLIVKSSIKAHFASDSLAGC